MNMVAGVPTRRARIAGRWGPRLLTLNLLGYPVIAMFATIFNLDSFLLSIPLRAITLIVSAMLFLALARGSPWWRNSRWLLLFSLLYLARLLYDLLVAGIPGADQALLFFITTVFVPGLAQGLASQHMPSQYRTAWLLVIAGGAVCIIALLLQAVFVSARLDETESKIGRLAFEALNPISLGHAAVTTLLALLCLTCYRATSVTRLVQLGIAAVAAICLISAGARGPILALGAAGFAFVIMMGRWRWAILLGAVVIVSLMRTDSTLIERLASSGEDASSLERLLIQGNAILQFLSSPIYGSAYTELQSLEYPHNLFIETAMAMGVIGLLALLVLLFTTGARMRREYRTREILVPMLFVQYFMAAQVSGAIWGNAGFFVLLAILCRSSRRSVAERFAVPPRGVAAPAGQISRA